MVDTDSRTSRVAWSTQPSGSVCCWLVQTGGSTGAGAATVSVLDTPGTLLSTAVMVTVPVLVVAPAAMDSTGFSLRV